jgi:predicted TIM-barrel fold metal-dependent hydrolase
MRDVIGVETIMWGSDYPHTESTFPRSKAIVEEILADVPPHEARAIVCDNAARLYGFPVPA